MFKPLCFARFLLIVFLVVLVSPTVFPSALAQGDPTLLEVGADGLYWVQFSPDGQAVAFETSEGLFKYDVATGSLLAQMESVSGDLSGTNWFWAWRDDRHILIDLWSADEFTVRDLGDLSQIYYPPDAQLSDDGTLLAAAASSGAGVIVYDISSGVLQPLTILEDPEAGSISGDTITITPDNTQVMASDSSGFVVWDIQSGEIVNRFELYPIESLYSPDRQYLLDANAYEPELWNLSTGRRRFTLGSEYAESVFHEYLDVRFSADGKTLVAVVDLVDFNAGTPGTVEIQLISAGTGEVTSTIASYISGGDPTPFNTLHWIDISPDGRYVAAASDYFGAIAIWDLQAGASDAPACVLTANRDTVVRSAPSINATQSRDLAKGDQVNADGQAQDATGFPWYRLTDMTWVRAETVDPSPECESLPAVNP